MLIIPLVKRAVRSIPGVHRAVGRIRRYFDPLPEWAGTIRNESVWWKSSRPDWQTILQKDSRQWKAACTRAKSGPDILLATTAGGFPVISIVESMLAVALTLRGARVHVLLCDKVLPACLLTSKGFFPLAEEFVRSGPTDSMCKACYPLGHELFRTLNLPIHRFSEFVTDQEFSGSRELAASIPLDEIQTYELDGIPAGEQAFSGALRYLARGDLDEPYGEQILRRYFSASLISVYAIRRLIEAWPFVSTCSIHGVYVPHGVIPALTRRKNIRSVHWSHAYRKHTFVFSHGDSYHHTMAQEPTSGWEGMAWTEQMEFEIVDYLKSRWSGARDWIWYGENQPGPLSDVPQIDPSRPCVGLLTNVVWDAQVSYRNNAFPNMIEWVLQTIKYFSNRPDLQLLIRVHPAEVKHGVKSQQPIIHEIMKVFGTLPSNVFIVPPESPANTYELMLGCDSAIIWATKTGLELAALGLPVIVAGEAWVRNKGFTMDAGSAAEYFKILDRLPIRSRLSPEMIQRARRYAYHFFFRRMIPLGFLQPSKEHIFYNLKINGLDDLMPGRSVGLDVICNGILNGDDFVYPAESVREAFDVR